MPNEWLLMMCAIHNVDPCRLRSQREKAIIDYLTDPAYLKQAVQELTPVNMNCYFSFSIREVGRF